MRAWCHGVGDIRVIADTEVRRPLRTPARRPVIALEARHAGAAAPARIRMIVPGPLAGVSQAPSISPQAGAQLAATYSHAALSKKVMSLVTKLEFCRLVFGRLDQFLGNKLIQNGPFVRLQIRARTVQ